MAFTYVISFRWKWCYVCRSKFHEKSLSQNMVNERQGSYKRNMAVLVQLRR